MNDAIFMAFDDRHWVYAQACLRSLIMNYPNYPSLLIFYNGHDHEKKDWLLSIQRATIYHNYPLPKCIENPIFHKDVNSEMVYYKYLLWTDMFRNYNNILHLDVDTIILSPLDDIFKSENFFIIRNNLYFKEIKILSILNKKVKKILSNLDICLPTRKDMVNAGVFVIPRKYRSDRLKTSLIMITNMLKPYLKYADQSAISLWCMRHVIIPTESYEYNYQVPLYNKVFIPRYKKELSPGFYFTLNKNLMDNIKIIHYSGQHKHISDKFMKWRLMGRYSKLFLNILNKYKKE